MSSRPGLPGTSDASQTIYDKIKPKINLYRILRSYRDSMLCVDSHAQKEAWSSLALLEVPGANSLLYKGRYMKGFFLNGKRSVFGCEIRFCTAARHYSQEHGQHSFWESSLCNTKTGPGPANGQDATCQLPCTNSWTQLCTTLLYRIAGFLSRQNAHFPQKD